MEEKKPRRQIIRTVAATYPGAPTPPMPQAAVVPLGVARQSAITASSTFLRGSPQ
jgi:hypothetical protein